CLSVALKGIDVGLGYAVWAGLGAVGAALLGPVFFDAALSPARAFWLAVIIAGVVWLKLADRPEPEAAQGRGGAGAVGRLRARAQLVTAAYESRRLSACFRSADGRVFLVSVRFRRAACSGGLVDLKVCGASVSAVRGVPIDIDQVL